MNDTFLNISHSSQKLIQEQLTQIKLLSNDSQIQSQQNRIFKDKISELEEIILNCKSEMETLESKIIFSEKEYSIKSELSKSQINKLEEANTRF